MTPPNAVAFNVIDTAQLDPGYVMDIANALDVAQVTIVQATHTKEAFSLAQRFRKERPQTCVFYRKVTNALPDENMVNQTRPDEWLRYFQDVLDIGCYGCIYNESLTTPIKKQNDYSIEVLNLTVPKGYRTVHFKIATGNPGGYNKEYLLPQTDPHYRPDEYEQSDPLWVAIYQANHPSIDRGDFPLAWVAPHMYFTQNGAAAGMTDRWREIWRRLDVRAIPHRYIPLASGEYGMVYQRANGGLDSGTGWSGIISGSNDYADIYTAVYKSELKPGNIIPHLFSLGDQQTANGAFGQWHTFDTYKIKGFWDRMTELASTGVYRLPSWYGEGLPVTTPPTTPPTNPPPATLYTPVPVTMGDKYQVTTPQDYINIHVNPDVNSAAVGKLPNGSVVTVTDEAANAGDYLRHITFGTITGWISMQRGAVGLEPFFPPPIDVPSINVPLAQLTAIQAELQVLLNQVNTIINMRSED